MWPTALNEFDIPVLNQSEIATTTKFKVGENNQKLLQHSERMLSAEVPKNVYYCLL